MTWQNHQKQSIPLSIGSGSDLEPARRLVVLVACQDADLAAGTRRVLEIANAGRAHVKFLGLCSDPAQESSLRRRLVTMSAMLNDGRLTAEMEILPGRDWVGAVKSRWQTGDMLVCLAEQRAGLLQEPLKQILQSDLDLPLTILSGIALPAEARTKWYTQAAVWIGLIAIVLGFCLLQVLIIQHAGERTSVLMVLSVVVEYGLIWFWHDRSG